MIDNYSIILSNTYPLFCSGNIHGGNAMALVDEISGSELKQWQDAGRSFQLLDVRTGQEMEQAMIPGGKPMEINNLAYELSLLSKHEELVFYCRSGVRSRSVCEYLLNQGYSKVHNLSGGIVDWYRNGYAMTNLSAVKKDSEVSSV